MNLNNYNIIFNMISIYYNLIVIFIFIMKNYKIKVKKIKNYFFILIIKNIKFQKIKYFKRANT